MANFIRPTFTQILESIQADINSRLDGADSVLRASVLNVIAYVVAAVAHGLYGFIAWISLQVFPDTAESEYLIRWAAFWGVIRLGATAATGAITVTGTTGVVITAGTEFSRADTVLFESTADVTLVAGTGLVPVTAKVAGLDGNTPAAATMRFTSPISFVNDTGTVNSNGLTGGSDDEEDAPLESRLLARVQKPPQGGSETDYVAWALAIPGVTRAWVYPKELGVGTVTVRFMMDNSYANGIPLAGDVTTVQDALNILKPVTATLTVFAPIADVVNFTIHLNLNDTPATRLAAQANLQDLITRDAIPGGTIYTSRINEAISLATGETDHVLSVPAANSTHTTGHIATMGTITWT